jgi:hypothetical protein
MGCCFISCREDGPRDFAGAADDMIIARFAIDSADDSHGFLEASICESLWVLMLETSSVERIRSGLRIHRRGRCRRCGRSRRHPCRP